LPLSVLPASEPEVSLASVKDDAVIIESPAGFQLLVSPPPEGGHRSARRRFSDRNACQ
jgi:hypothetical protein